MFHAGQQIGLYTLITRIGRGGFGEVWLAERRAKFVTTKVAVKLPLDEQVDHKAIKHEATLWEQASGHPNIVPIIDADEYDGQIVIVSEYAPDGSLEEWLKTHGAMPVERAVETTIQILDGLEFLHSRNIIHRDLKPANILLQGTTPRLADFGISRALRTTVASQSQNISGTFAYMSPEALDGKRSIQTDVWSVGVNLYRFLTGRLPFPQEETSNLIAAIIMREFEPLPADVPQNLQNVIARALAKQSESRYASAKEMREDLKKVLVNFSFPQVAPTKVLHKPILPKNIAPPTAIESEAATSEAEEETIANEKPVKYLTVTKPLYPQDSFATEVKEKESVITQTPTVKMEEASQILPPEAATKNRRKRRISLPESASQVLPTEAQAISNTRHRKKNNFLLAGFLLALIVAVVLVMPALIGITSINWSSSDSAMANANSNKTETLANTTSNINSNLSKKTKTNDSLKTPVEVSENSKITSNAATNRIVNTFPTSNYSMNDSKGMNSSIEYGSLTNQRWHQNRKSRLKSDMIAVQASLRKHGFTNIRVTIGNDVIDLKGWIPRGTMNEVYRIVGAANRNGQTIGYELEER